MWNADSSEFVLSLQHRIVADREQSCLLEAKWLMQEPRCWMSWWRGGQQGTTLCFRVAVYLYGSGHKEVCRVQANKVLNAQRLSYAVYRPKTAHNVQKTAVQAIIMQNVHKLSCALQDNITQNVRRVRYGPSDFTSILSKESTLQVPEIQLFVTDGLQLIAGETRKQRTFLFKNFGSTNFSLSTNTYVSRFG